MKPIRQPQCGLSLIELLVGMALGLMVVAAALVLVAGQLRDSRGLVLESRLMQDLRTASDLIVRDLRRAGYWGDASRGVWRPGVHDLAPNPYAALAPDGAASDVITFSYSQDAAEDGAVDSNEQFGFRLRNGAVQMRIGGSGWQTMTDAGTLEVTQLRIAPAHETVTLDGLCLNPCPADSATCPPQLTMRSLAISITGRAPDDATVVRSLRSRVRLRNDTVSGACPA